MTLSGGGVVLERDVSYLNEISVIRGVVLEGDMSYLNDISVMGGGGVAKYVITRCFLLKRDIRY